MRKGRGLDAAIGLFLLLLPLLWFAPQVLGGRTLLPADNLFTSQPWSTYAGQLGVTVPQNPLVSDLVLENYPWKQFLRDAFRSGQLPLWNSQLFAGVPFLAAGQHSGLYPLSILFYILPLWRAYGIFTWLQLGLAALGMYVFGRVLGLRRPAAALAAIVYAFSGFYIVSVNFTMVIAAAAWLPYILAVIELMARTAEQRGPFGGAEEQRSGGAPAGERRRGGAEAQEFLGAPASAPAAGHDVGAGSPRPSPGAPVAGPTPECVDSRRDNWTVTASPPPLALAEPGGADPSSAPPPLLSSSPLPLLAVAGAALLGVQILAGHVEITYYVLLVSTAYALWRFVAVALALRRAGAGRVWPRLGHLAGWLLVMIVLGLALGAVQLLPLYELVSESFREGSATLAQILEWAWPVRQLVTFVLPDAFGNPTHHAYFDIWARTWVPVTQNAAGKPLQAIDWGVKNYVEGGNYLGLLALLLAVFGTARALWDRTRRFTIIFFAGLAVLSLLFAFGTPLYAVLYYGLPGYKQLHSAFRWVFPYTVCMAILAGYGLDWLLARRLEGRAVARVLAFVALLAGAGALLVVALSLVRPGPFVGIGQRILDGSDLARDRAFANAAMAWSYEAVGLARFGLLALLSGAVLWWASRGGGAEAQRRRGDEEGTASSPPPLRPSAPPLWAYGAIAVLILDLWLFGRGFNPAVNPQLLEFKPPVVQWLQAHQDGAQPWRLTSYEDPGEKLFNPNVGMFYGLEDVRGYDSIIPRQYVAYMDRHQPQTDLLYNRIAPTYSEVGGKPAEGALKDPLLNILGVRYVIAHDRPISDPAYKLVYDGEVKVYENTRALPRAFVVPGGEMVGGQGAALDRLRQIDPRQTVLIEGAEEALPAPGSAQVAEARVSRRTPKEVFVDVNLSDRGWLVLTENFFPGWKAYLRPFGAQGEGMTATGESVEEQLPLYRADGTFRAVYLPKAGQWTVRFVYSPRSLLLGAYASFLAIVTLSLLAAAWAWGRYYRGERSEVGTVAKNSAVQMIMSLVNKGIDFAFAMLRLRILSPAGEGSFTFAINFYIVFEIVTRFGLGTLLTRDVARNRDDAGRYLTNVVVLRIGLWLASLPVILAIGLYYGMRGRMTPEEAEAIAVFAAALFFANIADALSSVFIAFEKMEYPAGLATAMTVGKVALGGLVLLPPFSWGFVGLTWVSLLMNVVQVVWLYVMLKRHILPDRPVWTGLNFRLQRTMLIESGPLMINNLLASAFWRLGVWILYDFAGAVSVGIFSAGIKYLDGLNVIPAYFTLAIFPLMSRYAHTGNEGIVRAYRLALQLLLIIALPIAVFVTFAATPMIRILGGAAYLPDSATALSIMIWSIPIGFMNSVTQYALIAVGQQRFLTRAFVIGVIFTAAANLIFIPRFGYLAAAAIMIPSELSLFIPFYLAVRRHVSALSLLSLCGVPLLATLLDAGTVLGLQRAGLPLLLAIAAGALLYLGVLAGLGTFRSPDFAVLWARFGGNRFFGTPRLS